MTNTLSPLGVCGSARALLSPAGAPWADPWGSCPACPGGTERVGLPEPTSTQPGEGHRVLRRHCPCPGTSARAPRPSHPGLGPVPLADSEDQSPGCGLPGLTRIYFSLFHKHGFFHADNSHNSSSSPCPSSSCALGSADIVCKQFEANGRLRIYRVKDSKWHDAGI